MSLQKTSNEGKGHEEIQRLYPDSNTLLITK